MNLTPKEKVICELLCEGCENPEIARLTQIPVRTVKQHFARMFIKNDIRDGYKRVKLAVKFIAAEENEVREG